MIPVTLTLTYPSLAEAQRALALLDPGIGIDAPDVGAVVKPLVPAHQMPNPLVPAAPAAERNPFAGGAVVNLPPVTGSTAGSDGVSAAPVSAPPVAPPAPTAATLVPTPPTAGTAPTGAPASGVELDAKGLPWDGRIHGSTKTKNADGTWRQKRGLNDEALKNRIEAELRQGQAARAPGVPAAPITAPVLPSTTAQSPVAPAAPASAPTDIPAPATGAAVPPAAPAAETFGQLMARLAPVTMASPEAAAKLNDALAAFQLTALAQLAARPDLIAPFAATIDAMLAAA